MPAVIDYLSQYIAQSKAYLHNPSEALDPDDYSKGVSDASVLYSRFRPCTQVKDYTGTGSAFDFDLPTDWSPESSMIVNIEYPAGDQVPCYIRPNNYMLYRNATKVVIRLLTNTPGASSVLRLTYTLRHSITNSASTVPSTDFNAMSHLAAGYVARGIAARYADTNDPLLPDSIVSFKTKSQEWLRICASEILAAFSLLGVPATIDMNGEITSTTKAAQSIFDLDSQFSWRGDFLVHSRDR